MKFAAYLPGIILAATIDPIIGTIAILPALIATKYGGLTTATLHAILVGSASRGFLIAPRIEGFVGMSVTVALAYAAIIPIHQYLSGKWISTKIAILIIGAYLIIWGSSFVESGLIGPSSQLWTRSLIGLLAIVVLGLYLPRKRNAPES